MAVAPPLIVSSTTGPDEADKRPDSTYFLRCLGSRGVGKQPRFGGFSGRIRFRPLAG